MLEPNALGPLVVARLLLGLPIAATDPADLSAPWHDLALALMAVPPGEARVAAFKAALVGRSDAVAMVKTVGAVEDPDVLWQPPIPFAGPTLPPFPVDALPPWLRDFVTAESRATQTPPDLAALLCLAVLSTACARWVAVRPWDGWLEPVNLFTLVVLPPGHRKSAVFASVAEPVQEFEAALGRSVDPRIARAESERAIDERALRRTEEAAARAAPDARPALEAVARQLAERLAARTVPPRPRLLVDDCSPERLATLLHEQGERIAVLSPEGGIFDLMAGRYGTGVLNLDHFLKGHAGDPILVDRVGRLSELVRRPAITMGLAVQPDVLRGLIERPGFRGRGLLARFLYALPTRSLGQRAIKPPPVPDAVRAAYHRHVQALLTLGHHALSDRTLGHHDLDDRTFGHDTLGDRTLGYHGPGHRTLSGSLSPAVERDRILGRHGPGHCDPAPHYPQNGPESPSPSAQHPIQRSLRGPESWCSPPESPAPGPRLLIACVLDFDPAAADRLAAFAADLEPRLADDGDLGSLADWGGKLVGLVARLSALLHLATLINPADPSTPTPLPLSQNWERGSGGEGLPGSGGEGRSGVGG